jgi:PGF-pre-PGF domain-containing protein
MTEKKERNPRLLAIGILSILFLLFAVCIAPVAADPLPQNRLIFIDVANDIGVKYDLDGGVYGTGNNGTYYIKAGGGGLNELHITADAAVPGGQVTTSNDQSGTFYLSNTGGRGFDDTIVLLLAVNGTVPDDFAVHIKSSGYTWTPGTVANQAPTNYTYVEGAVDETFTKDDFLYGPQTWKPGPGAIGPVGLPLYESQDMSDTNNTFSLMFIDLHAGNMYPTKFPGATLTDNGAIKVEYSFENLETFAAFNGYGWCLASNQAQGISWTNRLNAAGQTMSGSSGYSVVGIPPVLTSISVSPETAEVAQWDGTQLTATALEQRGRVMQNITFAWSSSDETVGKVNENGYFMALSPGTTEITATNGTVSGTATVTVTAPSVPTMAPMSQNRHIFINVANDDGVKYNLDGGVYGIWNNNTYYMKADGGGLRALRITADPANPSGQVTINDDQSGTLYLSNTGGRGFDDDLILLIAVNGTVPEDFAVHIRSSGYTWAPSGSLSNYTYVEGAVDETFTKEDFVYGPQTWKPGPGAIGPVGLPLYAGQDMSDTNNTFNLMFIDLNAGNLNRDVFTGLSDEGQGAVKVEYSFENLETFATFNSYGWDFTGNQGQGISFTNMVAGNSACGYSVVGIPRVLTSIAVEPAEATVPTGSGVQLLAHAIDQNDKRMPAPHFAWSSSDEKIGTVDANGYFTALSVGTTTVTAANGTVNGTATLCVVPVPDSGSDSSDSSSAASGNLDAGASTTLSYGSGPVSTVTVTVSKRTEGLMLAIMPVDNLPVDGPSGAVYRSLEADLSYADDSSVKEAVFTFAVPLSWLKEQGLTTQDIALMRYHNGVWSALPTEFVDENGSEARYRATSPGFSYFAITGMKGGVSVQPSAQSPAGTVTSETPAPTETVLPVMTVTTAAAETTAPATEATTQKSPVFWALPLVAFGLLFLFGKRE